MEELDSKELLEIIWKKKYFIIVCMLIGLVIGYVYNSFFTKPKYKASTTFLLVKTAENDNDTNNSISTEDVSLNLKLIENYGELIKSDIVLNDVLEQLDLNINSDELKKDIVVENKKNTEFIQLTVVMEKKENVHIITNKIIEVLKEKVKEIYGIDNIHIVDRAVKVNNPYNINPLKYSAIGAIIGIVISVLFIFICNYFDDSVKNERDIERQLKVKTLATFNKQVKKQTLQWDLKMNYVEDLKALRTNLQFVKREKEIKTVMITSTLPGEGKSWVATNLAIAFAKSDYKVCIVDADMRKGIQHKKFSVSQEPGLSNLILSRDKIEDSKMLFYKYIKTTRMENVFVLPSGEKTFDSSELLASNKIKKIINVLRENFDIVIFDSTPSMLLTDGIILSRLVETNIIVSEYEKTKIKDLRKTKELIEDVGGDVAGIIINKVNKGKKKYYYYESNKYSKH